MALLTTQSLAAGGAVNYVAATAAGDTISTRSAGATLVVRNASAAAVTVTVAGVANCNQGFTHSVVTSCAVGDTEIPIPAWTVNTTTQQANLTYSAVASVTVGAIAN